MTERIKIKIPIEVVTYHDQHQTFWRCLKQQVTESVRSRFFGDGLEGPDDPEVLKEELMRRIAE